MDKGRRISLCARNPSCRRGDCQVGLSLVLLVLRAKYEEGAGFRQGNSFLLQLQVGHGSGPRADGNFGLHLLIIPYNLEETSNETGLVIDLGSIPH